MPLKRVLLKLSGEALGDDILSVSAASLKRTVGEIKTAYSSNVVELAIVIGAGNIWRGA